MPQHRSLNISVFFVLEVDAMLLDPWSLLTPDPQLLPIAS